MHVYMLISNDKYELPICIADTQRELAEMIGVKEDTIRSVMSRCRKNGRKCRYVRVDFQNITYINAKSIAIQSNDAAVWSVIHEIQPLIMKTKDNIHNIKSTSDNDTGR